MNYYNNFNSGFGEGTIAQGNTIIVDGALYFDGEGDGLIINSSALSAGTGDFTLGFRFRTLSPQDPYSVLLGRGGLADFVAEIANYGTGQVNVAGGQVYKLDSTLGINDGQWHEIEIGRIGSDFSISVDNYKIVQYELSTVEPLDFSGLVLGRAQWNNLTDNNFRGYIDDFYFERNFAPTGIVTINGTATQGQTLSAVNTLADADGLGPITYTWKADGATVGTGGSYTLTQAEVGRAITVTASYTDGGNTDEAVTSVATTVVANMPAKGIVDYRGPGSYLNDISVFIPDGNEPRTLEALFRVNSVASFPSVFYTGSDAQAGGLFQLLIQVDGRPYFCGYKADLVASRSVNDGNWHSVAITYDSAKISIYIDGVLDTQSSTSTPGFEGYTYNNLRTESSGLIIENGRDGQDLFSGEIGYVSIWNRSLSIDEIRLDDRTFTGTELGLIATITNFNQSPVGIVTISGTAVQGQTLIASNTLSDIDGLGAITYTWKAGGATVGTGGSYTLTQTEVGKTVTVTVSYTDDGNTAESVTSAATAVVANVNDAPTGSVTISGTPTQGQTLTAVNTLADADGVGAITYTWKAGGATVGTGNTYTLTQAEVGKTITVTASYTDGGNTDEAVTSVATTAVANVNDAPTGSVTIGGTAKQGQTLSAANTLADLDGLGAITYTWKAGNATVGTGANYTLTQAEVDKTITVTASYTDGGGSAESVASGPTVAVVASTGSTGLTGLAYHWKSHTLLDTVDVQAVDQGAVSDTPTQLFDLRAAVLDPRTGKLTVEVWANPLTIVETIDFTAVGPAGSTLTFTSALGADWTPLTNTSQPGQLLLGAYLSSLTATGLTVPTQVGTLEVQQTVGATDVQIAFSEIQVGASSVPDLALGMAGTTTGADGAFEFTTLPAGHYGLSATRAAGDGTNGVTSADALAALRLAVGINPNPDPDGTGPQQALKVSPYQFMAADANQDGKVSAADALAILRMAVKLPTALPQEWFFVEETRDLWNEITGQSALTRTAATWDRSINATAPGEVNLVGVLKGDVNGSWTAPAGAQDLDVLEPGYLADLAQRIGAPLDQFGVYSGG